MVKVKTKPDRKLQHRYGKLKTQYHHYTAIAEGVAGKLGEGYSCPPGSAFLSVKTWASSPDESMDMVRILSEEIGFKVTGKILIYDTEPVEPPKEDPYGYDIGFSPFDPPKDK